MKIGKLITNDALPTFQVKEVLDAQYTDITNVYHWFKISELDKDYLYRRTMAIQYINTIGYENLDDTDKFYACKNYCAGSQERSVLFSEEEQEEYWYHFVVNSEKCRKERWDRAKSFASYRLQPLDSSDLAASTSQLNESFIKYGIETQSEDGKDGLIDWLLGTGSFVDGSGFSSKTYYTLELANGIVNKLKGL